MPTHPLTADRSPLPLEDHGLIGDGATCATVARDGSAAWLRLPEDSAPFLAGLLDAERGGESSISGTGPGWEIRGAGRPFAPRHSESDEGLLSGEIDPRDGSFPDTVPQAFSRLRVLAPGTTITEAGRAKADRR